MRKNNLSLLILGWLLIALTGCGNEAKSETPGEGQVQQKVTHVTLATVEASDIQETFTLPGTLEAWEDLTLAAEIAGPVRWIGPEEGQRLEQGQSILRIDPETLDAQLARNKAEYDRQKQHVERRQRLVEKKLVSVQEYDDAVQAFKVAEANLRLSQVALQKSTLKSPVPGVLDALLVDRGEYVSAGDPVAQVVQVDRLKVLVDVPEKDVPYLKVGDEVQVSQASIDGREGETRRGTIIHLAYRADPLTRTYRAKIEVDNQARTLRPGMIVRVEAVRRALKGVIAIPLYALVDHEGTKVVYVEEQGLAHMRQVGPGAVIGKQVIIREGLSVGERLIVKGQQLIGDGSKVVALDE